VRAEPLATGTRLGEVEVEGGTKGVEPSLAAFWAASSACRAAAFAGLKGGISANRIDFFVSKVEALLG